MFKTGRLVGYPEGLINSLAYNGQSDMVNAMRFKMDEAQEQLLNRADLRPNQQGEQMVTIADKAKQIVLGDRERVYGHPAKNLERIAKLWSAYLDKELTAYDVCNLMAMLKIARLQNTPGHEDTLVDIIGYTLLQERVKDADKVVTNT